jgi:uncharacterized protein (TIGR02118 family)
MVKLTVLYGPPTDPAAFDTHYFGTHVAIVDALPGIVRNEVSRFSGSADGSASPYYLQAELYYESRDALDRALASVEGQAASADVANFATGTVTLLIADVVKER